MDVTPLEHAKNLLQKKWLLVGRLNQIIQLDADDSSFSALSSRSSEAHGLA
jgi:hypothetical protein